jgi:riboflavin kinase/FMN adenylyltransferase
VWAIVEGKNYPAVLNIGRRPTLDNGDDVSIEVHLFHFEGELYERELSVTFVVRMRDEMCFPSLEALQEQIQKDSEMAQCILFDSDTH